MADKNESFSRRRTISTILLVLVVIVPSFFSAYNIIRENEFATQARHFVKQNKTIGGTYIFDYTTDTSVKPYTLTLQLAGEMLSKDSRAKLYAEAEKHGIRHGQIIFQEDATIEVRRLNETEIMKDWLSSTEEQLRQCDDSIRLLNKRLNAYEALVLPSEQIAAELRSQWPEIADVTLARADSSIILLLSTPSVELSAEDTQRIQNWLSVRLQTPKVEVIVR